MRSQVETTDELLNELRALFSSQRLAVLCTQNHGQPYGDETAVFFVEAFDFDHGQIGRVDRGLC